MYDVIRICFVLHQAHGAIAIGLYRRQVCTTTSSSSTSNDDGDGDWQYGLEGGQSWGGGSLNRDHEGVEGRRTAEPFNHPCTYTTTCTDTLPYVITAPAIKLTVLATDEIFILRQQSSSSSSV